jgi:phage terminase large subunit-like protein
MRRIVGGIQINRHSISPAPHSLAVTPHYADRQGFAHPIEFFHSHPILETRQRRLGGQVVTFDPRSNSNLCLLRLIATYPDRGTGGGVRGDSNRGGNRGGNESNLREPSDAFFSGLSRRRSMWNR